MGKLPIHYGHRENMTLMDRSDIFACFRIANSLWPHESLTTFSLFQISEVSLHEEKMIKPTQNNNVFMMQPCILNTSIGTSSMMVTSQFVAQDAFFIHSNIILKAPALKKYKCEWIKWPIHIPVDKFTAHVFRGEESMTHYWWKYV